MAVTIQTKHEDGDATDVPSTLSEGELAVNTQAQKLWVGPIGGGTPVPLLGGPLGGGTADGQTLRWEADSSAWEATSNLVVADSGNVGIGTASPARALEVVGTTATTASLSSNQTQAALAFKDSGTSLIGSVKIGSESEGMFFNAASVERMRITSDGNVGIGTDAPVSDLEVEKAGGATIRVGTDLGQDLILSANASAHVIGTPNTSIPLTFTTANTERMRIDSAGNVGIGTSAPTSRLTVNAADSTASFAGATFILPDRSQSGIVVSKTAGATADPFGLIRINAGNAGDAFFACVDSVGGTPHILYGDGRVQHTTLAGTGNRAVYSDANGFLTNTASDERLKENIAPCDYGMDVINALAPVSYTWKDTERMGTQTEIGFIAQAVKDVVPEAIGENNDGMLSLDYPKLTAVLVKAIQELSQTVTDLTTRLEALEA
jgi:hypothetical protein